MARKLPAQTAHSLARVSPTIEAVTLAGLAVLVLYNFRADFHRSLWVLNIETAVYVAIPILALVWTARKFADRPGLLDSRKWSWGLQTAAVGFAFLPILTQLLLRLFGVGDSYEIVALAMLLNACWFLSVFSQFGKFGQAAFAIGLALVLFISLMTKNRTVYVLAFFYALVSLWWLLGDYWNRVTVKAIDGDSHSLPIRGAVVLTTLAVITCVGGIASFSVPIAEAVAIKGFMPSSGGDSWYDAYARSGIGDGDMLTAGQNATTAGAVDSDQFIEDDKPSMYDVMMEKYDGPVRKKKKRNRAVALAAVAKHMHNVVQSEQSGRSFRTVRQPKGTKDLDLENKITKALFFVEGAVPARFTMDCFHHFDGWDWTKQDLTQEATPWTTPEILLKPQLGKPWLVIGSAQRDYLAGYRAHQVKIMRLADEVIPAPPLFKSWHIAHVANPDFFEWNEQELVRFTGDSIPPQTMINVVSHVPNYHVLRKSQSAHYTSIRGQASETIYTQVPGNGTRECLVAMARDWTDGIPVGWQQVETVIKKFREKFILDPTAIPPDDCDDSVGWFLDNGRGPAYLFATAATQTLRAAGYRTRLASGFIATKVDYDRLANQSIITSDNAHMWPEVCLDECHWLPVEPTPGYPIPYSTQTIGQQIYAAISAMVSMAIRNPVSSLFSIAMVFLCVRFSRVIVASLGWMGWRLALAILPQYRLKLTRQLLDLRYWAANFSRPSFACPSSWMNQFDSEHSIQFVNLWQSKSFNSTFDSTASRKEIYDACFDAVDSLTVSRIKQYVLQNNSKDIS